MQTERLLELSELTSEIALKASEEVMDIYQRSEVSSVRKSDGSPVTEADISSHKIITEGLTKLALDIPILSEEDATKRKLELAPQLTVPNDGINGKKEKASPRITETSPRTAATYIPEAAKSNKSITAITVILF